MGQRIDRYAWNEIAEQFETVISTLKALEAVHDDAPSATHLHRALAAAERGAQLVRQNINVGDDSQGPHSTQTCR